MKRKASLGIALIYAILLGVFNLLVFVIFKNRTNVFWVSYGFMTTAFVVQIISLMLAFKTADIEAAFFGIPLASFSVYYLIAALAVGLIFMIFQRAGFTLATVIQVLVLATFLVVAIISVLSRDAVQSISENVRQKVVNHKSVLVDIQMMEAGCGDPELKVALRKLTDTVKYSDPMSTAAVESVEQRIMGKVAELQLAVDNGQFREARQICKELELLYTERNKKLALSK